MHPILTRLSHPDRRTVSGVAGVVAAVLADPGLFSILIEGMESNDPALCMRAADAAEKISAQQPDLLRSHKRKLIAIAATAIQQEVRWHVAIMITRVMLTPKERTKVAAILQTYLTDKSSIVKTFAMQALADLAQQDTTLRGPIRGQLEQLTRTGTPAMRARGRKLLIQLEPRNSEHR
jgi:hypothetical protein